MSLSPSLPSWLARLYPFTPGSITTSRGATMSYLDEGPRSEQAVLMLHGNPTWSFYYRELVQALSPVQRCVVPDHIGMGLSEKPPGYSYRLETRISDIEGLVASLGLKKVHLVVHDWGGAIGFGLAARRPELIGRIVILNTAAFRSPHIPARIQLCKLPVVGPFIVRACNGFAWPATWMAMKRRTLSADEKRGLLFPYGTWGNRIAVSEFVQDIPLHPGHPTWATLQGVEEGLTQFRDHPALILWGGKDFCFNDHFLSRWREVLPNATVRRFEDAGHYVLADAREDVVPQAAEFLTAR
jgi:haloalkane dehalogenase